MSYRETIVLSLGGSLISPNSGIDTQFLKEFGTFIRKQIAEKNRRFFIVCGGGATARHYIEAGSQVLGRSITDDDKDWLGIHSTRLNAHLVRTVFRDIAFPRIFKHYDTNYDITDEPVIVCSGWKPGWSTDFDAVLIAEKYGAKTIVNLSNIDKVYDKDPRKYSDAKPIEKMTWAYFEKLVGDKWTPGLNAPFDPVATQKAKKLELSVIILNGKKLKNLEAAIDGKKFIGTVIAPFTLDASFYDRDYYEGDKGVYASTLYKLSRPARALYRALLIKFFFRPKKVLDVGCAQGNLVQFLRLLGIEAYGMDVSAFAYTNALPSIKKYLRLGDIRKIPFKTSEFDLVTTFNVLEHVYSDDIATAINECSRVSSKYQFHKIYTQENSFLHLLYGTDLSQVSVFDPSRWEEIWKKHKLKKATLWWPRLPSALETAYLLQK